MFTEHTPCPRLLTEYNHPTRLKQDCSHYPNLPRRRERLQDWWNLPIVMKKEAVLGPWQSDGRVWAGCLSVDREFFQLLFLTFSPPIHFYREIDCATRTLAWALRYTSYLTASYHLLLRNVFLGYCLQHFETKKQWSFCNAYSWDLENCNSRLKSALIVTVNSHFSLQPTSFGDIA